MLGYVRLNSMGKNERQTEEMLLGILQDILEAQENGVSAQDYFGKAPQPIADELLKQLPNDAKQMVKISLLAVLTYFAVVFIGSYFVSLFQPGTPQLIDVHIFDHLHQNGKQIILTSDKAPADIQDIQERIVSRFKWGLSAEVKSPDFDTRKKIIVDKLHRDGIVLKDDMVDFLSGEVKSNV